MNNFLLEIYGEEIPSWAQRFAEKDLKDLIEEFLILKKVLQYTFNIVLNIIYYEKFICIFYSVISNKCKCL